MFDQTSFECADGRPHVLLRLPTFEVPWPPSARFVELDFERAVRVLGGAVRDRFGNPNWRLLHALGIDEHPYNLAPGQLEATLRSSLGSTRRRYAVHERLRDEVVNPIVPALPFAATPPAPSSAEPARDFFHVQLVDDEGTHLGSVLFELTLPDAQQRMVSTDAHGSLLVEGITPGSCTARLSEPKQIGRRS